MNTGRIRPHFRRTAPDRIFAESLPAIAQPFEGVTRATRTDAALGYPHTLVRMTARADPLPRTRPFPRTRPGSREGTP
ncbi:hypothetical protein GCM10019016_043510 [Streptomyces prasinosporus]|uniref:Uncharacterized protein n=1 Tax=Streptomyces prasinosporus TaxID=68256 RepID=A0ABP6TR00_9ACTN